MPFLQQKLNNYDVFALKRHTHADVVSKVDLFDRWKEFLKKNPDCILLLEFKEQQSGLAGVIRQDKLDTRCRACIYSHQKTNVCDNELTVSKMIYFIYW